MIIALAFGGLMQFLAGVAASAIMNLSEASR